MTHRTPDAEATFIRYRPDLYDGGVCHGKSEVNTHADFCNQLP